MIAHSRTTSAHVYFMYRICTIYIRKTIQFPDVAYSSSCHLAGFFLCWTDGLVVIGRRWGFRGNIKHPTQMLQYICPSFDSQAEIISKLYCLLLSHVCQCSLDWNKQETIQEELSFCHHKLLIPLSNGSTWESLSYFSCNNQSLCCEIQIYISLCLLMWLCWDFRGA